MADEKSEADNKTTPVPKRFPLKTLLILLGVLLMEVATVAVVFMLAGGPAPVAADHNAAVLTADGNKSVEELVVQDRFANTRQGDVYLYDTEVYVVVRKKHQEKVKEQLKNMSAQFHADLATIFRRADPSFMHEDDLQTLSRQIKAIMDQRLGVDADGEPVVQRVLMTKCTPFRVDF